MTVVLVAGTVPSIGYNCTADQGMTNTGNVVDIGELRLSRQKDDYRRRQEGCQHKHLEMDEVGETVHCLDCKAQVSSYWALNMLRDQWATASRNLKARLSELEKDQASVLHLKAAKAVEAAWRSPKYAPACPHCRRGILLEDGFGSARVSKDFEKGLRVREQLDNQKLTPVRRPEPPPARKRGKTGKPLPKWENAPGWALWLIQDPATGTLQWASELQNNLPAGQVEFAGTYPLGETPIQQARPIAGGVAQ